MSNLIVVFGVSGVGKTTACRSFVTRNPEFAYITASEVLRRATGLPVEQLRRSSKEEVLANQKILTERLPDEITKHGAQFVLLDAQNIIDNGRDLIEVPVSILEDLSPRGVIVLEADPNDVYARRNGDGRFRPSRTPEELSEQMNLIRRIAFQQAARLDIPCVVSRVTRSFELDDCIQKLLSGPSA